MSAWENAESTWRQSGIVEYGIYQIDAVMHTPIWRRHEGAAQTRFSSVHSGLFGKQGARNACKGLAPYTKGKYAAGSELFVPYAAVWLRASPLSYLVRASAQEPEVTLVQTALINSFAPSSDQQALSQLAEFFAVGAGQHGVRWLKASRIESP
jgi:hypothetical protein